MNRDSILIGGLTIGALCILAAWYLSVKDSKPSLSSVRSDSGTVENLHPLVKEQGVSVLYSLDQPTQDTLIAAVQHFCVKNYERDSCVHHFATCGHPCLVVIPQDKRKRIVDDYKALRKSRGLPDLKPLPQDN